MTTTFRAKSPEDLLAVIPITLGFEPEDSIVMLTFGGPTPLHARIDLPPRGDPDAVESVVEALLDPCRRHLARRVIFVLYGSGAVHCRRVARLLRRAFEADGIEVIDCLRADGGRWFSADGRRSGVPPRGVPYDVSAHPFRAEAVMAGHVTLGSRADLAAGIAADPAAQAELEAVLHEAGVITTAELAAVCDALASSGRLPTDLQAATILLTVQHGPLRDAAWVPVTRESAAAHVTLWRDLVRRAPDALMPSAAAVLAFAAWLAGDGALAWCALDRCFAEAPRHSLGELVAHILSGALPPSAWESMRGSMEAMGEMGEQLSPGPAA